MRKIYFLFLLLLIFLLIKLELANCISAIGHLKKGDRYLKEKKYTLAIKQYRISLKINPYYKEAYHQLGLAYLGKNELEKAEECFKKAISLHEDYFDAHNNLGLVYEEMERFEEALKEYNKAKDIEPGNYRVYYNLGGFYHKRKDFKNAFLNYEKVLKIKPDHAWACINLGSLYLIEGKYFDPDKAMAYYRKALLYDPKNAWININIASIYLRQGLINKAIREYQKSIRKDPSNVHALSALASIYISQERYLKALPLYQKIIKINPKDYIAFYNIGLIYEIKKNYKRALKNFKIALSINPYDELALHHLENIILKTQDISSPLRKKYAKWHLNFGHYYFKEREIVLANYEYKRSIRLYPQDPNNRFAYCNLLKYRRYIHEEIEEIKKVIELDPKNIRAKDRLEKLYYLRPRLLLVRENIDLLTIPPSGVTILIIKLKPKKILHQHLDRYLTYLIYTFLKEFPQLRIIPEERIEKFLKKNRLSSLKEIEDIFKAGKALDASMALWGEIYEEKDEIRLFLRLVDIDTLTNIIEVELSCEGNNRFKEIINKAQKYILKNTPLLGRIIKTKIIKNQVIINLGARHWVKEGDTFNVWEKGSKYLDPATGRTLRFKERIIGKIRTTKVENNISLAVPITFELIKYLKNNKITLAK